MGLYLYIPINKGSSSCHAHKFIARVEIGHECSHAGKLEGMDISMPIEGLGRIGSMVM